MNHTASHVIKIDVLSYLENIDDAYMCKFWTKKKQRTLPVRRVGFQRLISENQDYYVLTQHIRNSGSLTTDDISFIENLDRERLIELAKLYNEVITNLSYFINESL